MITKTIKLKFGKRLADIRKAKGFTQKELGKKIGVSQRVIAYYEGETNYPPALLLPKIADVLSISIDELFSKTQKSSNNNNKLWKKLRKIENLPDADQKAILTMIDRLIKK